MAARKKAKAKAAKKSVKAKKVVAKAKKKVAKKKPAKKPVKKVAKKAVKKTTKKVVKKKVAAKKKAAVKKPVAKKAVSKKQVVKKKPAKKAAKKAPVRKPVVSKPAKQKEPKVMSKKSQPKPAGKAKAESASVEFVPYSITKNEDYMSDEQLDHFRHVLGLWKDRLMGEVDTTVIHMKEEALSCPDPLDRASQEEGFSLELRTRDRERKLIKKIEQALDLIERGEYGYCESCGTEIGVRRLEARPTADKCIDCKTFEEIREKQSGG